MVYEYGSLGCSGDLAPLAHVALAVMGEGQVRTGDGELLATADALRAHGLAPVTFAEKEGLALINGTDGMLGQLVLALTDLDNLFRLADIAAAMSVEGQLGTDRVFADDLQQSAAASRPGRGGREHTAAARGLGDRGQPPGSGLRRRAGRLLAAVLPAGGRRRPGHRGARARRSPNANWPVSSTIPSSRSTAGWSPTATSMVRRWPTCSTSWPSSSPIWPASANAAPTGSSTWPATTGCNAFLADDPGVDSGHMIAQYTQAGIVSELKRLATPASADSIPSSAMQEDHVSMGWSAARKLRRAIDGLTRVLAIEVLTAARGIDMRAPLTPSPATGAAVAVLREHVEGPGPDRYLAPEIAAAVELARSGAIVKAVEDAIGPLG